MVRREKEYIRSKRKAVAAAVWSMVMFRRKIREGVDAATFENYNTTNYYVDVTSFFRPIVSTTTLLEANGDG